MKAMPSLRTLLASALATLALGSTANAATLHVYGPCGGVLPPSR